MTTEQLTTRERHMLARLREAEELGVSLEYYASAFNVELRELQTMRQQLMRKGVLAAAGDAQGESPEKPQKPAFIPVRLVPSASAPPPATAPVALGTAAMACRLVHPSGWTIECGSLPEVAWVRGLLAGACP